MKNFVSKCDTCQRKEQLKKAKKPLHSIAVSDNAFSQIGMDLIGPLEETKSGKLNIVQSITSSRAWTQDIIPGCGRGHFTFSGGASLYSYIHIHVVILYGYTSYLVVLGFSWSGGGGGVYWNVVFS